NSIALHTCENNQKDGKSTNPSEAINAALTNALWQTQHISEYADLDGQGWGELHCTSVGRATDWYFRRREALRKMRADGSTPRESAKKILEQMSEEISEALGKQQRP